MWVPLEPDDDARRTGRAGPRSLRHGCGSSPTATGSTPTTIENACSTSSSTTIHRGSLFARTRVDRGEQPFVEMWNASGGQARYDRRSAWIDANRDRLLDALTR